jgi:dTDP-4-amino-4,6-dideoxygalactose transaminase
VNAAIGLEQLKQLPAYQARRAALARQYFDVIRAELKAAALENL